MKIKFDATLQFQLDAISAIVDIFQGQEKCDALFTVNSPESLHKHPDLYGQQNPSFDEAGYGNYLALSQEMLLKNVQKIQLGNGLKASSPNEIDRDHLDFTIEMETGTGKTYVYLRTILELYRKYGFSKHIIVVPSIPIKEGVYKSLEITQAHFRGLYDNVRYNFFIYDSSNLNEVWAFANNTELEIMVINIDSFSKSFRDPSKPNRANIIHRYSDTLGHKPLDLIRNTKPLVFVDEPQTTMSTDLRKTAVNNLNPLAIIRYSATHRETVNLMYKLNAVDAFEQKLVKQIEVGSVETEGANNQAYIKLVDVNLSKGSPTARVEVDALVRGSIKRKTITVRGNDDLEQKTNRTEYAGYIINDIHGVEGKQYIDFTSREGHIKLGESVGGVDERQVKTVMIRQTIEEHLDKELRLNPQGIKVLSLFFIDKVAKYRQYDQEGVSENGEYAHIFEREYAKLIQRPKYHGLFPPSYELNASEVHNGYFSIDRRSKKSSPREKFECYKDTRGTTRADEDTYSLIMRDKEKLLSFDSKLRFIFSHSALKEGWDNPNVFQICTLRDLGGSSITPRQQIGRGLRLCVNQEGERVSGHKVNTLSIIATESYHDFAKNLQEEIEKDIGIRFGFVEPSTFADIVVSTAKENHALYLGQEASTLVFHHLINYQYIDQEGKIQNKLRIDLSENMVDLPEEISREAHIKKQVLLKLKNAAGRLEIKNKRDRIKVEVNRRMLENPDFHALWERVKYKTTFSVGFDSNSLIEKCIEAIDELPPQTPKLHYTKSKISINTGGIEVDGSSPKSSTLDYEIESLPDIVSYLQNETHLTRKTVVEILTKCKTLDYFKINPQKFIRSCIDIINDKMRSHITHGIKYQRMGKSQFFSQELFEKEELFGYMNSNLVPSTISPYDYVVYDSNVESRLTQEFEFSQNVTFYSKLPNWFKIDTPLGSYNPDWVLSWKNGNQEKLFFFVIESKASIRESDLRPSERSKFRCGKKHFEALGSDSELILVSTIEDIENRF